MSNLDTSCLYLGTKLSSVSNDRWFSLSEEDRRRHIYVIGQTGSGKSTFLRSCIIQDIELGRGLAFLDPHGQEAEHIIDAIPSSRIQDVLYLNPSDLEFPIGFNPLRGIAPEFRATVTANLTAMLRSIWSDSWGPRLEHILSNTIAALLEVPKTYAVSFLSISRMLTDETYRRSIIEHVRDPVVRSFWENQYPRYKAKFETEAISPVLNKIDAFSRHPALRNILCQNKSRFDLSRIMDERKILVVNLSKGLLGDDVANLLGSLLVCSIQHEAMNRAKQAEDARVDFTLYIDEFQNFTTDAFDSIVSEARKYRLSLVIAHQYLEQISERVRDAILGNVGNLILFTLGGADAEILAAETKPFAPGVLREQSRGEMLVRCIENGITSDPVRLKGLRYGERRGSRQKVINVSRRYARPRQKIESKIERWFQSEKA